MLVDLLLPERIEVIPFEDPRVLALDSLHDLRGQAVDVAHLDHVEQIRAAEQLEVALDGLGQVSGDPEDPPPTLALLAVLSLAAENRREGDGKAANNFYGRLAELLSLDDKQREDFIAAYRKVRGGRAMSDVLWGSLSLWLELLEGNRGLVTVFAERNVHVSLPMSQALVREVDRDKFRTMFGLYGLAARCRRLRWSRSSTTGCHTIPAQPATSRPALLPVRTRGAGSGVCVR